MRFILKICHCLLMVLNVSMCFSNSKNELRQFYFTFRFTYSIVSLLRFWVSLVIVGRKIKEGKGREGRQTIYHLALIGTATYWATIVFVAFCGKNGTDIAHGLFSTTVVVCVAPVSIMSSCKAPSFLKHQQRSIGRN